MARALLVVGFLLDVLGFAFLVLDIYTKYALAGSGHLYFGNPATLLYVVLLVVGTVVVVVAERRRKQP